MSIAQHGFNAQVTWSYLTRGMAPGYWNESSAQLMNTISLCVHVKLMALGYSCAAGEGGAA
jgi:hypothetical protein